MNDDRSDEISSVLLKGLGLLVCFALVVAIGTWLVVRVLGLNADGDGGSELAQPVPVTPLPTTALAAPHDKSARGKQHHHGRSGANASGRADLRAKGLHLSMTPLSAHPDERLNITGTYAGHDNISLQVQRLEDGTWSDFPTQAQVSMGTFQTYVMTTRTGPNRFRVFDPTVDKASNVVTVTIR
ncbi:hypothetical protein [Nocardioides terrisoli]|uniref:hypothetical protein n=1 Tax=Nocardioides terrisoli TaxID=3388267 RepID=UPI00287B8C17|nr:hypothetical protein [Nocardioides marmorisolisilvae]